MPKPTDTIDPRAFRNACGAFATGVTVITTRTAEGDHGMTANAFMSVSLAPPLVAVSIDKKSRTLDKLRQSGRFAVNVLSDGMLAAALHYSGRPQPNFVAAQTERDGLPLLPGSSAYFLTDVVKEVELGDHVLFVGHVSAFESDPSRAPLVFSGGQFCQLPIQAAAE